METQVNLSPLKMWNRESVTCLNLDLDLKGMLFITDKWLEKEEGYENWGASVNSEP